MAGKSQIILAYAPDEIGVSRLSGICQTTSWHLAPRNPEQAHPWSPCCYWVDDASRRSPAQPLRTCSLIVVSLTAPTRLRFLSSCRRHECLEGQFGEAAILQALVVIVPEHVSEFRVATRLWKFVIFVSRLTNYCEIIYGLPDPSFPA